MNAREGSQKNMKEENVNEVSSNWNLGVHREIVGHGQTTSFSEYAVSSIRTKKAIGSEFITKLVFKLADLALVCEEFIMAIFGKAFNSLPLKLQTKLTQLNDEFKELRDRALGNQELDSREPGKRELNNSEYSMNSSNQFSDSKKTQRLTLRGNLEGQRGDVPGWVLVVLMTTGLVTALWAIAAPRLSTILKNSLDSMNKIR